MAVLQGAMIGGYLLPEQQFKEVIKELFLDTDNIKQLKNIINKTIKNINSGDRRAAYENMEELQTILLSNPSTSIMLITNLKSPEGEYSWSWVQNEKDTLRKSGKISYAQTIQNGLVEAEWTEILSKHLLDMIKTVETTEMSNPAISKMFKIYNYQNHKIKSAIGAKARENRNLKYAIYGDNPQYRGQIADAFLNHVGNMHKTILTNKMEEIKPFNMSVLQEEGENFLQLLIDSKNNTPWYTGGDLIILGNQGNVVANIQLKTILNESADTVGRITISKLRTNLQELKKLIDKESILDSEAFADKIYRMFATSGVIDEITDEVINIAYEETRKALNLTT